MASALGLAVTSCLIIILAVDYSHADQNFDSTALCKMYSGNKQENVTQVDFPILDCSYRNLESIPRILDNRTLWLDLTNNKLSSITGSPFKQLVSLLRLNLTSNAISYMTNKAFSGLHKLLALDLSQNMITILPTGIFSELAFLQYLDLNSNLMKTIPSKAVAHLYSLQSFCLHKNKLISFTLGEEFQNLRNVSFLSLLSIENSLEANVTNETFQYLNVVPEANLELHFGNVIQNNIITTSVGTLRNVKTLTILLEPLDQFESTDCQLETLEMASKVDVGNELLPLQYIGKWNSTLISLTLIGVIQSILKPVFSYVPILRILNLEEVDLMFVSDDAFDGLMFLEKLILSHNHFRKVPSNALGVFTKYATLRHLDLSNNDIFEIEGIPVDAFAAIPFLTNLNMAGNRINFLRDWTSVLVNLTFLNLEDTSIGLYHATKYPSLKTLLLAISKQKVEPMITTTPICHFAKFLQKLTLNNNWFLHKMLALTIGSECLNLHELDISGCLTTSALSHEQADINLPNLEILVAAENKLESIKQILFIRTMQLLALDLSYNEIQTIEVDHLSFFNRLKHLNLEGNKLISLSGLEKLSYLEILLAARNQLNTVPNFLLHKPPESALTMLDLGGNPFDCTCNIMQFKKWMTEDNITWLIPNKQYICFSPDILKGRSINNISLDCRSHLAIYLGTAISCALFITILTILGIRYRWHIKYKLFLMIHYRRIRNYDDIDPDIALNDMAAINYPIYDAYIAYADECREDECWVINNLSPNLEKGPEPFQLYIKGRDFTPGASIIDSISESIQQSCRTILVLTPHFVESEWCYFEMRMARMRLFDENRDVLILVMLEEIPDNKMTLGLRQLLCEQDYFKWPADNLGQNLFWRRLRAELKKPVHVDRRYCI